LSRYRCGYWLPRLARRSSLSASSVFGLASAAEAVSPCAGWIGFPSPDFAEFVLLPAAVDRWARFLHRSVSLLPGPMAAHLHLLFAHGRLCSWYWFLLSHLRLFSDCVWIVVCESWYCYWVVGLKAWVFLFLLYFCDGFSITHTRCLMKYVWDFELFVGSILI
jgi:hypothetical protein